MYKNFKNCLKIQNQIYLSKYLNYNITKIDLFDNLKLD